MQAVAAPNEEALFLSLRTCATHPAGPLRAVAELQLAVDDGRLTRVEARGLAERCLARYAEQPGVLDERLSTVHAFLRALWC